MFTENSDQMISKKSSMGWGFIGGLGISKKKLR
jgi:hypothetical protein